MSKPAQKIFPHLWFDTQAVEAAQFYSSIFPDSSITHKTVLRDIPSGDSELVSFTVWGQHFVAISAGPLFKINPAISFIVNFDPLLFGFCNSAKTAAMETQAMVWEQLAENGTVMMPLDAYPFSERFGWVQDRYGVSWQLILSRPEGDRRPPIVPSLMFTGPNAGKAEQARAFYLSVFGNSREGGLRRYPAGMDPEREGSVLFSDFMIENTWLAAADSAREHAFGFNEAISFMISCDSQAEIDRYWDALNADPEGGRCGWLKDRYGVSWQVVPAPLHDMLYGGPSEAVSAMMRVLLDMKKLDIASLEKAFRG